MKPGTMKTLELILDGIADGIEQAPLGPRDALYVAGIRAVSALLAGQCAACVYRYAVKEIGKLIPHKAEGMPREAPKEKEQPCDCPSCQHNRERAAHAASLVN